MDFSEIIMITVKVDHDVKKDFKRLLSLLVIIPLKMQSQDASPTCKQRQEENLSHIRNMVSHTAKNPIFRVFYLV